MVYARWISVPVLFFLLIGRVIAMSVDREIAMPVHAHRSFFRLFISNGLIAATFTIEKQVIDGIWPNIYKKIDETHPVPNLVDQIGLQLHLG